MQTLPFLPIKADNWNYDVEGPPHKNVYIINRTDTPPTSFSALCTGDEHISFVIVSATREKAQEYIDSTGIGDREKVEISSISWQTLCSYARGILLDGEFLCVSGGWGWVASALTWTPTSGLVADPYTLAVGCRDKKTGEFKRDEDNNVFIDQDVPSLLAGIGTSTVESPDADDVEFVVKTFMEWATDDRFVNVQGRVHDVKFALYIHPVIQKSIFGSDPEEELISRIEEK
jgi:hypothetical protein